MPTVTVDNDGYFEMGGEQHIFIKANTSLHLSDPLFLGQVVTFTISYSEPPYGFAVFVAGVPVYCMNVAQTVVCRLLDHI